MSGSTEQDAPLTSQSSGRNDFERYALVACLTVLLLCLLLVERMRERQRDAVQPDPAHVVPALGVVELQAQRLRIAPDEGHRVPAQH